MRLWHYRLIPYLPEAQFKGQLRELVTILHDWRDKGQTNHILINQVMEYPRADFYGYFMAYATEYQARYDERIPKCSDEFLQFKDQPGFPLDPYPGWHDYAYLRVCMANLYEKHAFGHGPSRITEKEWKTLLDGYKEITGEDYKI